MAACVQPDRFGARDLPDLHARCGLDCCLFASSTLIEPRLTGLFTVRKAFLLSGLVVPLLLATVYSTWRIGENFKPLSRYVNLSQACEIMNGGANDVVRLRRGHPVTRSQTHLNRDRYKHSNEGIFVVAKVRVSEPNFSEPDDADHDAINSAGYSEPVHGLLATAHVGRVPRRAQYGLKTVQSSGPRRFLA